MSQLTVDPALTVLAFGAGLLSFLSPCVLPLVPAYLGYITGVAVGATVAEPAGRLRAMLSRSLSFVIGLAVVFTLLGATASAAGQLLLTYQSLISKIAGVIIIVFGLHLAGIVRIPFLYRDLRFDVGPMRGRGHFGAFLMGASFGIGWTPCVGAFLGSILLLASQTDTVGQGMALLFVYALGLGLPFIAAGLGIQRFAGAFRAFKRHSGQLAVASGVLMIVTGMLVFSERMLLLTAWMVRAFGTGLAL